MLSITDCRRILGGAEALTDEQIKTLRDHLYELAALALACSKPQPDTEAAS